MKIFYILFLLALPCWIFSSDSFQEDGGNKENSEPDAFLEVLYCNEFSKEQRVVIFGARGNHEFGDGKKGTIPLDNVAGDSARHLIDPENKKEGRTIPLYFGGKKSCVPCFFLMGHGKYQAEPVFAGQFVRYQIIFSKCSSLVELGFCSEYKNRKPVGLYATIEKLTSDNFTEEL